MSEPNKTLSSEDISRLKELAGKAWMHAGEIEPHDDEVRSAVIVLGAYGWQVGANGRLYGLVSGDMGYAATHIILGPEDRFSGKADDTVSALTKELEDALTRATSAERRAGELEAALKLACDEIRELRRFANNNGGMFDSEEFEEGRAALEQS